MGAASASSGDAQTTEVVGNDAIQVQDSDDDWEGASLDRLLEMTNDCITIANGFLVTIEHNRFTKALLLEIDSFVVQDTLWKSDSMQNGRHDEEFYDRGMNFVHWFHHLRDLAKPLTNKDIDEQVASDDGVEVVAKTKRRRRLSVKTKA